jgi:hypothetical protein
VELAAVPEGGSVGDPAASRELRAGSGDPGEMAPEPGFPLGEEPLDVALRSQPATPRRRRDRHHHASLPVNGDAKAA